MLMGLPDIRCGPGSDGAFVQYVEDLAAEAAHLDFGAATTIDHVQLKLRDRYPNARIRLQSPLAQLSIAPEVTWYVEAAPAARDRPIRVVAVDDDPAFLDMVGSLLSDEGYDVRTAGNARAALDVVAASTPDVILLDLEMPGGDGEQFMSAYRERPGPHAQVIVLSGHRNSVNRAEAMGARNDVRKPFNASELLALVRRYA
jgi:CheY-like chemotaxis protein